jgi:uncharacterized membrane protein YccC
VTAEDLARARGPVAWSWSNAVAGMVYALPATLLALHDPTKGLAAAVGVLAAAAVGVRGPRRRRVATLVVGAVAGLSLFIGSCVSQEPVLAVATVFVLCVLVAVTSTMYRLGPLVLAIGLPLVGAGLSESGPKSGLGLAVLMIAGAAYAWLVSLCWPDRPDRSHPPAHPVATPATAPTRAFLIDYGVRLGLAGGLAAAAGYAAGIDHPGWGCCAALIVSRPSVATTQLRVTGRAWSVLAGACAAIAVEGLDPSPQAWGALVLLTIAGVAGTSGSRWYITPAFSTFLVISLLVLSNPTTTEGWWFLERIAATLLGVALSWVFMVLVPRVRVTRAQTASGPPGQG